MFLFFSEFQGSESRLSQDQPVVNFQCVFLQLEHLNTQFKFNRHVPVLLFCVQFALPNKRKFIEYSQTLLLPLCTDNTFQFCSLNGTTSYSQKQTCILNMNSTFELILFLGVNAYYIQYCWSGKC